MREKEPVQLFSRVKAKDTPSYNFDRSGSYSSSSREESRSKYYEMYPQKVSITPVKRRLDYKAALGIVDESPKKRGVALVSRPRPYDQHSIYTESGESEYSDDYTIGEEEYTDGGSSYYDSSSDESYERALSVFSRRGNNQFSVKKRTPFNVRDNI